MTFVRPFNCREVCYFSGKEVTPTARWQRWLLEASRSPQQPALTQERGVPRLTGISRRPHALGSQTVNSIQPERTTSTLVASRLLLPDGDSNIVLL